MTSNEQINRLKKALRFADLLLEHGITSEQVRHFPTEGWKELTPHVDAKEPPSESTIAMIFTLMAHREQNPLTAA